VVSHSERFVGAVGISAPFRDAAGQVIGDIIAAWPDNRTDAAKEHQVATAIVAGADRISADLGFRPTQRM
jgi:DNA-binding IclR family transcriptional regulator